MKRRNLLKILSLVGAVGLSLSLSACDALFKEKVENGEWNFDKDVTLTAEWIPVS